MLYLGVARLKRILVGLQDRLRHQIRGIDRVIIASLGRLIIRRHVRVLNSILQAERLLMCIVRVLLPKHQRVSSVTIVTGLLGLTLYNVHLRRQAVVIHDIVYGRDCQAHKRIGYPFGVRHWCSTTSPKFKKDAN